MTLVDIIEGARRAQTRRARIAATLELARQAGTIAPPYPRTCDGCGVTLAPDGTCLEIGTCPNADATAARRSTSGQTSKYAIPAAWNARGNVD